MHELSLVTELVSECYKRADGRSVARARVRCPLGIDAEELVEGFAFVTSQMGGPGGKCLSGASLEVEPVRPRLRCRCGFSGPLSADDIAGHISICPGCGGVGELDSRLELLSLAFAEPRSMEVYSE